MNDNRNPAGQENFAPADFKNIDFGTFTAHVKTHKLVTDPKTHILKHLEVTFIIPDHELSGGPDGAGTISGGVEYALKHGLAFLINMSSVKSPEQEVPEAAEGDNTDV